jgi:hypothetical protein
MSRSSFARGIALSAPILASAVLALPFAGQAAAAARSKAQPRVSTGGVGHLHGTSGVLQGTVNPRGLETTYFFQYGPTTAYGSKTPTAAVGKGTVAVKVGQTVASLQPGYHYRVVASNSAGTTPGRDRTFTTKKSRLKFVMASTREAPPTPYGGTFVLRGTLSGTGGALHTIALQSSPYPFLSPFAELGAPLLTNAAGAFALQARNLTQSTQFRVVTRDTRPLLGPIVTAHVAVRVTLKVRSAGRKGLVRLYGTVTPAKVGARVLFQLQKATRPRGKSEKEVRFATQSSTVVKRGTRTISRFSSVVTITKGGRYRAYVLLRSGALVSGASPSVTLHAGPSSTRKK